MAYYSRDELLTLGLAMVGENVLISKQASLYNYGQISIGNNVRIDDFCVLSAGQDGIEIGNYIHIAPFCSLIGAGKIKLSNFCNLSSRVSIYSSNDDYTGQFLTNPTVPAKYTGVFHANVILGKHVIIGSGSVVLPGIVIEDGAAVGSLSLVKENCRTFGIYSGVPAKFIKERKRDLLKLEIKLLEEFFRN